MNKKILTFALALTMAASQGVVFAENTEANTEEIMLISENETVENQVRYLNQTIKCESVEKADDYITISGTDENDGPVNVLVFSSTLMFDNTGAEITVEDIKEGTVLNIYVDANSPMTMQYPPTYRPQVVIAQTDKEGFVDVDTYGENGINASNTIQINDAKEQGDLVVFYTNATKSIPASVTPSKIVKIEALEEVVEDTENVEDGEITEVETDYTAVRKVVVNGEEVELDTVVFNGSLMLPVRSISEKLGYEIAWDENLSAVTVGTVPMGVNFAVGVNAYNKARMMPATLSNAPIIVATQTGGGLTYVPVEFFSDILGTNLSVDGENLTINQ